MCTYNFRLCFRKNKALIKSNRCLSHSIKSNWISINYMNKLYKFLYSKKCIDSNKLKNSNE